MKKLLMTGLVASVFASVAHAQTAAPAAAPAAPAAPTPPYTVAYNIGAVSDYYFRGISQTWHAPAIQGGVDLTTSGGWYTGLWASNISDKQYAGGSAEIDYYGGYNGKFNDDWGWTAGLYGYYYPSANTKKTTTGAVGSQSYNTIEWNAGVSWKWLSLKYSETIGNAFGLSKASGYTTDSKGSSYIDLTATYPLTEKLNLIAHVGSTDYKTSASAATPGGATNPDYQDFKLGVTYAMTDALTFGAAVLKSSNSAYYNKTSSVKNAADLKDLGKPTLILSVGYVF